MILVSVFFSFSACDANKDADMVAEPGLNAETKEATEHTVKVNAGFYSFLDFGNKTEYEFATKGLIDAPKVLEIKNENGALLQYHNTESDSADLTVTCPKNALVFIIRRNTDGISASMKFEGDATKLQVILDNLNQFSSADNA